MKAYRRPCKYFSTLKKRNNCVAIAYEYPNECNLTEAPKVFVEEKQIRRSRDIITTNNRPYIYRDAKPGLNNCAGWNSFTATLTNLR